MKVIYCVQERRSGKTTDLVKLFRTSGERTYYFCHNPRDIKPLVPVELHKRIKGYNTELIGCVVDHAIIDEYDLINDKNFFWQSLLVSLSAGAQIMIMTTPDKKYKKVNFYTAKFLDSERLYNIRREFPLDDFNEIMKLKDSILFKPNTKIINEELLLND